jgi:predicted PurR-regulated permease PerM
MGRPVLLPLALAVLMSFALAPLVGLLRHLKLGHVPSVLLSLAFALVLLSGIGTFVGAQFAGLASDLPLYQSNIAHKIESIRGATAGSGTFARLDHTIQVLADQISGTQNQPPAAAKGMPVEQKPVPV